VSAATKPQAPKLTLRDTTELELLLDQWIEEHIDEVELGGGALPDDLAQLLDEVQASRAERADAIAAKVDRLTGDATAAKATKDRAARRERVATNAMKAIKAYAMREVQRLGGEPIRGTACVLRMQKNGGKPAVEVRFENEQLLAFKDTNTTLSRFITIDRVARLDSDAIAVAYLARQTELEQEVELLGESDIPEEALDALGPDDPTRREAIPHVLQLMRSKYIARTLADEFPGVTVTRGFHLRID
jgi:hypothetical protein